MAQERAGVLEAGLRIPDGDLVCLASDLGEDGKAGRRWLLVCDGEVVVLGLPGTWDFAGPPHGADADSALAGGRLVLAEPTPEERAAATVVRRLPLGEISGCKVEPMVAAGTLVADTKAGPVTLIRFSSALSADFGLAARAISAAAKGQEIAVDPRDLPRYCPHCGRRLGANTRVCPYCVDRGAVLRRLLRFAAPYRVRLVGAACLMIVGTMLAVLPPRIMEWITNGLVYGKWPLRGVLPAGPIGTLAALVAILIALNLSGTLIQTWQGRLGNWIGSQVMGDIRSVLWAGVQRLSLAYFDKAQVGQIMQRINSDTQRMQSFLTGGIEYVAGEFLQLAFALIMMLSTSWRLTLVVLVPAPALLALSYIAWPRIIRYDRRLWQLLGQLNVVVNDALGGVRVVKAFGQEPREIARFNRASGRVVGQSVVTGNLWATIFPIFSFVSGIGGLLIWYVGGTLVLHRELEFGAVVATTAYMGMVLGPLQWFSQMINQMLASLTSAERVFEILDTEPDVLEAEDALDVGRIEGRVALHDVQFGYAPHLPVLKGVSLEVEPGEMIGLVGPSGAGKSTLINLICRLYDPDAGSITVDGHDLRRLRLSDVRSQLGVVLQDTFLFDGTIAENIAYARPDSSLEEIMRAASIANAHEFIVKLPDGYDSQIGERGARLSGGERQRIAIARAVLHDPRILILDEATASVDTETERKIQQAIARLVKGRTTFAIAHRLSTLRNADRLVVVDGGKIVEVGTHDELMEHRGKYADLVNAQRENAKLKGEVGIGT